MAKICSDKNKKMMKTTTYHRLMLLLLFFVPFCYAQRMNMFNNNNKLEIQVEEELNRLNKPGIKSIESADGDIIDCVLISQQPGFDHPLLQNHTIQMMPSYHPEGLSIDEEGTILDLNSNNNSSRSAHESTLLRTQLWQLNGSCPKGSIPVRRIKKEDILRASSVSRFGKKEPTSFPRPHATTPNSLVQFGNEHAVIYEEGDTYHGTKAYINMWNPRVEQPETESSLSQMWVLGGVFNSTTTTDFNTIEAGLQVNRQLFGDDKTRFFIYWTPDGYQSEGCYNLLCPGFIQTNRKIALGTFFTRMSTYGGPQFDLRLLIWKDAKVGVWWCQFGDIVLGYWPQQIFTHLSKGASAVQWGGVVMNARADSHHTTTQMGSGHFADEGFTKASYFNDVQIVDDRNTLRNPRHTKTVNENSNCYNVKIRMVQASGVRFYYGGPGRNPHCT